MASSSHSLGIPKSEKVAKISRLGEIFLRYGLTVGIGWIAAMKFHLPRQLSYSMQFKCCESSSAGRLWFSISRKWPLPRNTES